MIVEKLTQKTAEKMVEDQLRSEGYSERQLSEMPNFVEIGGDYVKSFGDGWTDTYKIVYVPTLVLTPTT